MSDPTSNLRTRIKAADLELARFERQASTLLAVTLTLAIMTLSALTQLLP